MKDWQKKQDRSRRAPNKRVAVTMSFTSDELVALGHEMGIDEPTTSHIRRFMTQAIDARLRVSKERYEDSLSLTEDADIAF